MADTSEHDRFLAAGQQASQIRDAAHESYSKIAGLVRERLQTVQTLINNRMGASDGQRINAEAELALAERLKSLAERELDEANANLNEWRENARARQEEARLRRQERATTSATWAAWGSAVAALASLGLVIWNLVNGRPPAP